MTNLDLADWNLVHPWQHDDVPGMNWDRVHRENQATSDRRAEREANSPRKAFSAKYKSTCGTCYAPINVGDRYASTLVDGERIYHHERCVYRSDAVDVRRVTGTAAVPTSTGAGGKCRGTTNAGKACDNGAKKGELYCGPHLDKLARDASPTAARRRGPAHKPSAYDPYYDDPF